jgi:hypothetical protein
LLSSPLLSNKKPATWRVYDNSGTLTHYEHQIITSREDV